MLQGNSTFGRLASHLGYATRRLQTSPMGAPGGPYCTSRSTETHSFRERQRYRGKVPRDTTYNGVCCRRPYNSRRSALMTAPTRCPELLAAPACGWSPPALSATTQHDRLSRHCVGGPIFCCWHANLGGRHRCCAQAGTHSVAHDGPMSALCSLSEVKPQWLFWVLWILHFFAEPS